MGTCIRPSGCPHPRARSPLCGTLATAQQPGSTLQHRASMSPSQLSSVDRTQCSPEIQLIGWRFFLALYWSDGLEGLAEAEQAGSCVLPAPKWGWTQNSCWQQVQPQLGTVGTIAWALCECADMAVSCHHYVSVQASLCSPTSEVHMQVCSPEGDPSPSQSLSGGRLQKPGHHSDRQSPALPPLWASPWGSKPRTALGRP